VATRGRPTVAQYVSEAVGLTPVHLKSEDIGFTPWSRLADVWGL